MTDKSTTISRTESQTTSGVSTVCESLNLYEMQGMDDFSSRTQLATDVLDGKGKERATWGGQLEFILTCVGCAVGLGNVWRFPYLCYKNGGGAFLIPYVIMLCLVGVPLFFMELSFGQFASLGPLAIWKINPVMKGLGFAMLFVSTMINLYYNVIVAWCLHYFVSSMTPSLPWEHCNNPWNTIHCKSDFNDSIIGNSTADPVLQDNSSLMIKTPSEEYFYSKVLNITDGIEHPGGLNLPLTICLAVAWLLVFLVLVKGIQSLGKVVYFSSIFPYVLLTIMLIRGVTLPGAIQGIKFYLNPDFSRLTDARVWSDAAVQIFYSLGTCMGALIAMASYNKFNNNCFRDALLVPVINCATSVYSGFVIFSVLGFMAHKKGVDVADVASSGPGLVFVVYPEGLSQMPLAPIWAVLFFFMMLNLGLGTQFANVECVMSSIIDEIPSIGKSNSRIVIYRGFACGLMFVLGLPMVTKGGFYVFYLIDTFIGGFPLLIIGLLECLSLNYIYGYKRFAEDIEIMLGKKPSPYFKICWCFISPLILFVTMIFVAAQYEHLTLFDSYTYPNWSISLGWSLLAILCCLIVVSALWRLIKEGILEVVKSAMTPTAGWGPANPENRTGKYAIRQIRGYDNLAGNIADHQNDICHKIGAIHNGQERTEQL